MPLTPPEITCKVELYSDEEGTRLICANIDKCPFGHPGELHPECFSSRSKGGPLSAPLGTEKSIPSLSSGGEQVGAERDNAVPLTPPSAASPFPPEIEPPTGPSATSAQTVLERGRLSATSTRHRKVAKRYGEMILVNERNDESLFEADEEPVSPPPPPPRKKPEPEPREEETDEGEEQAFFEPLVEEFESQNGYLFSLTLLKDEDGDFFVDIQLDNVTVQLPVEDFMELMSSFQAAIPGANKLMNE